jgi:DNA polymerase I-like protein with 3'-5' exonuclease and polymerase domains
MFLESLVPNEFKVFPGKSTSPWFRSPQKLSLLLYTNIGFKEVKNKMSQALSTDEEALNLTKQRYPVAITLMNSLMEYRSMLKSLEVLNMKLDPDGRVRTSLSPTTETFRYRSSANVFGGGTNLQNISKGNKGED